ncbi:RNA methylase [Methanothermobacter sp. MT-2]|nr:RNA methylase [Methanothermobacter sp. MT-2]HOK72679.1 rRNA adenine N-6-methyltransferase family protein [Methanothermobacter sp.]HPQ04360.1 rRNA adenine N-6-methyltransferase family protein [Methanothermobacter sp.]HPU36551.1 rRNA adenine N-6-methyltransferase family protein [Methanothermobacter sp.]
MKNNLMRFLVTTYHYNLLKDYERLSCFYEAIKEHAHGIVYDIGAGSGILSYFAAPYSRTVFAIEKDEKIASYASQNLKNIPNVKVVNRDALSYDFPFKADTIICEMLDTALIDEEQVPVINKSLKHLKKDGCIIPYGVINGVEPIEMDSETIRYDENCQYKTKGKLTIYDNIIFNKKIKEKYKKTFKIPANGKINGLKITTFTLLTENIIAGPTSMMNNPLLIPIEEIKEKDYILKISLSYKMGGGLQTIKTKIKDLEDQKCP